MEPRRRSCFFRRGMSIRLFPPISTKAASSDYREDPGIGPHPPGDELRRGVSARSRMAQLRARSAQPLLPAASRRRSRQGTILATGAGSPGGPARSKCIRARTADHGPTAQLRRSRPDASTLIWPDRWEISQERHRCTRGHPANGTNLQRFRSAPWTVDVIWLLRRLRHRSSSTDVPDNMSESHTAARPFPGPRHASWHDVPDNRPLSDGCAARPWPPGVE